MRVLLLAADKTTKKLTKEAVISTAKQDRLLPLLNNLSGYFRTTF